MTHRNPPWLCDRCGYMMDATTHAFGPDCKPKKGDLAVCLNCAAPYQMKRGRWRLMTAKQFSALPDYAQARVRHAQAAQLSLGLPNLASRDRWA